MTAEEQKAELLKQIKETVATELETRATKDDVANATAKFMESIKDLDLEGLRSISKEEGGVMGILKAQSEKIEELSKKVTGAPKDMSLRAQIESWVNKNKAVLDKIKEGNNPGELPEMKLNLRAAITMTEAASLNSSAYLPNPGKYGTGIVDLVRVQPTFWNQLSKGSTRSNPLYWVNKTNKQGNATFIGEGVLKELASFELSTEISTPKKVAERMRVSTEMLYDIDYLETEIMKEMRYEVETAANTAVLTGVGSSTSPAGITTIASAFNLTTVATTNPTTYDVIRAAIAQIRTLNFNGVITAYMNPIDIANMDMEKATDSGVYIMPPFISAEGTVVKGVRVIEDNNIAVGYLLIGEMDKYKILMHEEMTVRWGLDSDDFSKNLVTAIAEMRFHQFYSANHTGAWIYDAIADIKTAITAASV
jgi:Phage capsid family